jgi:enoyl-CoA hydratase/carnithine racemase
MGTKTITYEVRDRTATITFDRPERLNAISPEMAEELRHAYAAAEADPEVWTLLVTGNGRAF